MVRLIARGPEESAVYEYLQKLAAAVRQAADPSVRVLGPAPAPIIKIRNLYRFHLQVRCVQARPLQGLMRDIPAGCRRPRGSSWRSTSIRSACCNATGGWWDTPENFEKNSRNRESRIYNSGRSE